MPNKLQKHDHFSTEHLAGRLKQSAVRGAGAIVTARAATHFIRIGSTIVLARLLSPSDFGLVAMVTSITGFLELFKRLGLTDATIQEDSIENAQISALFWLNAIFGLLLTLLTIALAPFLAFFYKEPRVLRVTIAISAGFLFGSLSTQHLALLKRNMRFSLVGLNEFIAAAAAAIVTIVMAFKGFGYWAVAARPIIFALVMTVTAWMMCSWRPHMPRFDAKTKRMLKFGLNVLGNYAVSYFSRNLDKTLIGWRLGPGPLGYYHKAFYLAIAPLNLLTLPLSNVAAATLSRLRNNRSRFLHYYSNALAILANIGVGISIWLFIIGNDLILLLLGEKWQKAGPIFSIFCMTIASNMLYSTHAWLHVSLGRSGRWFRWSFYSVLPMLASFFIGLPYGALGVAIGYAISINLVTFPGIWYAARPIKITMAEILTSIWRYYLAGSISATVCFFIHKNLLLILDDPINRIIVSTFSVFILHFFTSCTLHLNLTPIKQLFAIVAQLKPAT